MGWFSVECFLFLGMSCKMPIFLFLRYVCTIYDVYVRCNYSMYIFNMCVTWIYLPFCSILHPPTPFGTFLRPIALCCMYFLSFLQVQPIEASCTFLHLSATSFALLYASVPSSLLDSHAPSYTPSCTQSVTCCSLICIPTCQFLLGQTDYCAPSFHLVLKMEKAIFYLP